MDNLNDNWLDDILGQKQENSENAKNLTDTQVIPTGKLQQSDDLELERIVQETIAENWGDEFPHHQEDETAKEDPDATQFFVPQQTIPGSIFVPEEPDIPFPAPEDPGDPLSEVAAEATPDDAAAEAPATDEPVDEATVAPENEATEPAEAPDEAQTDIDALLAEFSNDAASAEEDLLINELFNSTPSNIVEDEEMAEVPEGVSSVSGDTEQKDDDDEPIRKGRPAKKKGYGLWGIPHLFSTAIWAAIILFIGVTLGRTVWLCAVDLLALGKTGQEATIIINPDDTLTDVAKKLESVGMIRYSSLFETFAKITGKGDNIQPGTITFDPKIVYDYNALINAMSDKDTPLDTVTVTIPEGYTCKQIFALLEEKGVCTVDELEKYAANGDLSGYWFLEGLPRGTKYCLEGYLFPDTYDFYLNDSPKNVLEKFLDDFNFRFSDRLREKYETLNNELGLGLSVHEVLILASMVQKEKASDEEGYVIASVFYNRMVDSMSNSNSKFHYLNCDATIDYAESVYAGQADIINSYDTYKVKGLPPSPICNPGQFSLDAALAPDDVFKDPDKNKTFYYFVLDKENNEHVFAQTLAEHEKNMERLGYYD